MQFSRKSVMHLATLVAIALTIFQVLATGGFIVVPTPVLRGTHLAFIMVLVFLWKPIKAFREGKKEPLPLFLLDLALALISAGIGVWIILNCDYLEGRLRFVDLLTEQDWIVGTVAVVLVLEITRRTSGWPLVLVALFFLFYAFFGQHFPGSLRHNGILTSDLLEMLFLSTDGIYGVPLAAASTMIFAFVMFGAFLERANMSSLFMDLACLLTRKSKGGPAKVAIFASALFGTISGSAPANVYGTGTFTIPLMKRVGYTPAFAGAVEAVASTGGQMMPPIMGAAAFIMADLVGTSYLEIAKSALLPSILYYLALLAMIHFEAVNKNIGSLPEDQIPPVRSVVVRLYFLLPLVALIFTMLVGRSIVTCAFIGIITILVLSMFRKDTRFTFRSLCGALELTARNCLMISATCACAGIVVAVISLTGVGYKFINFITIIAGDNLLLLMICLMITSMILGMGVPTSPAYIIVATLGAPALIKAGVPVIAAHMFVFYYAILSAITPPVCVASFSGAAIAKASPMQTGWVSVKLGIVAFIIPYMFTYQPALLLQGEWPLLVQACITSIIGVLVLSGGLQGYFIARARMWERLVLLASGLLLIDTGGFTDIIGICLTVFICLLQLNRKRRNIAPAMPA